MRDLTSAIQAAVAIALIAAATVCTAQQSAESTREAIEVTGSRISSVDNATALPVQTITRQDILDGGVQTMQELLERISANQSYGGFSEAMGEGKLLVGFTAASLRGLGSQRTLILLDGQRLAPYALSGGQSVDLSGIPASAIERVEVLRDGASAVYGTDAIGGVINFILRKNYDGAEISTNYYATDQGGGNSGHVSVTAGHGDLAKDKFNFFVSIDLLRQNALSAAQRQSTRTAYLPDLGYDGTSTNSFPANITQSDPSTGQSYGFSGTRNPTIPYPQPATSSSCAPPYSFVTKAPPTANLSICRFDFASVSDTIPEADKANAVARFTRQFAPEHQFFAQATYYRGQFTQRVSPAPADSQFDPRYPLELLPSSPYYPTAFVAGLPGGDPTAPILLKYRTVELGPRTDEATAQQWNGMAGLQGTLGDWNYNVSVNYTANQQIDDLRSGYVRTSTFATLLQSGIINPFGSNTEAAVAAMRATAITGEANDNRASNYGMNLTASRNVYELPAGPLAVAFGLESRRESLEQSNADFEVDGDILGGGGLVPSLAAAHRSVWSLFGETTIPLTDSLEANAAVRYDHYSDFGSSTNPKFRLRWQPARYLVLRGSYGTGFRAPTLSDLFQPQARVRVDAPDPARCPVTGADSDCDAFFDLLQGGNTAVQPEKSKQVDAGIVVEPLQGLSASADYYRVKVRNVITTVPLDTILGPEYARWQTGYVVRNPPDAQYPDLPGTIASIIGYPVNVGSVTTAGVDFSIHWRGIDTRVGRFSASIEGTYVLEYKVGEIVSADVPSGVGTRGATGAISRYRQYGQVTWTYGHFGATLANTYAAGYSEPCTPNDVTGCDTRRVGDYSIWDIQGRYTGVNALTLAIGIRNALNTAPPLTNQSDNFQVGIDPSYADPRGRTYYATITYAFK